MARSEILGYVLGVVLVTRPVDNIILKAFESRTELAFGIGEMIKKN